MTFGTNLADQETNAELFDRLFEQHRDLVFSFLLGRCGDRELAKDLLQETFLRVWQHIGEAANVPAGRKRFWIVAIAKNVLIDSARRQAVRPMGKADAIDADIADSTPMPDKLAETRDALALLDRAIKDLPEDLRAVLVLSTMEGLNSKEIGTVMGIPAGTARYQLFEARKLLAAKVGNL